MTKIVLSWLADELYVEPCEELTEIEGFTLYIDEVAKFIRLKWRCEEERRKKRKLN